MRIKVTGRQPLRGTYQVSGNSNAAMALVAASMLSGAPVQLSNVPDTVSVGVLLEIGADLGLQVDEGQPGDGRISLNTPHIIGRGLSREHTDALSGTLLLLAPDPGPPPPCPPQHRLRHQPPERPPGGSA